MKTSCIFKFVYCQEVSGTFLSKGGYQHLFSQKNLVLVVVVAVFVVAVVVVAAVVVAVVVIVAAAVAVAAVVVVAVAVVVVAVVVVAAVVVVVAVTGSPLAAKQCLFMSLNSHLMSHFSRQHSCEFRSRPRNLKFCLPHFHQLNTGLLTQATPGSIPSNSFTKHH
jgi:ABC-type sugar transport system permease subunit